MKKTTKVFLGKLLVVIVSWIVLAFIQKNVLPVKEAQSAVLQLQDSDEAYAQFKGVQSFVKYFWVLYLLPLTVYIPNIRKLTKGDK